MPSVEHTKTVAAPFATVWPFVRDMDNWAPLVTGYQNHTRLNDKESIWALKGELGGLTRVAEFKAVISEWDESGRVLFTLEGVSEPVTGSGTFLAEAISTPPSDNAPASPTLGDRLSDISAAIARFFLDLVFRRDRSRGDKAAPVSNEQTQLTFNLTLNAGGMAGVPLNMLITPMLKPVAEDLANGIADAIVAQPR